MQSSGHHTCAIPSGVSGWTVHGIWPSEGSTKGPNYCDNSWPFDASKIQVSAKASHKASFTRMRRE